MHAIFAPRRLIPRSLLVARIAILHYTVAPAVGGIENLIQAQSAALAALGHDITLIFGQGATSPTGSVVRVPELHPDHPAVNRYREQYADRFPPAGHPLVIQIMRSIAAALDEVDQCWVHNALTVYLNPFLTVALVELVRRTPRLKWIAWCEDLSAISAFWPALHESGQEPTRGPLPGVTYITISATRRRELAHFLGLSEEKIGVVSPPLNLLDWLDAGEEVRLINRRLNVLAADPLVLVPAKLLAHKNLGLAVEVAAALHDLAPRPLVLLTGAPSPHESQASLDLAAELRRPATERGGAHVLHLLPDILGHPPGPDSIRDLMLLSDLVFLPSTEEGYGTPVREAAALRTPVLCSGIPAFREAGGLATHYFPLGAAPSDVARRMLDIAASPTNALRRKTARSEAHFRDQIESLVSTPCR